uniref:DUF309 domain-containing protein n=1 Tax=Rhizophora mucronata TaxID=61149 RepID=A0A2P2NJP4_RHIMU
MAQTQNFISLSSASSASLTFTAVSPHKRKSANLSSLSSCPNKIQSLVSSLQKISNSNSSRISYRYYGYAEGDDDDDDGDEDGGNCSFNEAVALFNNREYYKCHDVLEALWIKADEPTRTLVHGILQCAVGFYHLFNQNHKGAMMELGEGLCKLRKMKFESGPFHEFEQEISDTLNFIYQTQIELAACGDDLCLAMDGSERSYQLLGSYATGQHVYNLQKDDTNVTHITLLPQSSTLSGEPPRVKLPILNATEEHLISLS